MHVLSIVFDFDARILTVTAVYFPIGFKFHRCSLLHESVKRRNYGAGMLMEMQVIRGFLTGLVSGMLLFGLVLAILSYNTEIAGETAPESVLLEVPPGSEFIQHEEDRKPVLPEIQSLPSASVHPGLELQTRPLSGALPDATQQTAAVPETADIESELSLPENGAASPNIDILNSAGSVQINIAPSALAEPHTQVEPFEYHE